MNYQYIEVEKMHDGLVVITLNRAEKRNALNIALMEELTKVVEELNHEPSARVIILTANGPVFCAGMDLQEAADMALEETTALHIARLFTALYTSPLVTIAALQGDAIAGGGGIVAACDFALMSSHARIGFPETRRGLIAAQVATLLLRQLRKRDVRALLLSGELVSSRQAFEMGLASFIVKKEDLRSEAIHLADSVLKGAPEATKNTKRLLNRLDSSDFIEDLQMALSFHHTARHTDEAKEGVAAFLEKRKPSWNL